MIKLNEICIFLYFINVDLNTSDIFINKTFLLKLIWKGYKNVLINIYTIIIKKCRNWNLFSHDFLIFLTNNIIVYHVNYAKNAKKNFNIKYKKKIFINYCNT